MIKKILLLLLLVIVIASIVFWFNREQWLEDFNVERQQNTALFKQKGASFGAQQGVTQDDCLQQSFKQLGKCFEFSCTLNQGLFLKTCLAKAEPVENFCTGVPEFKKKPSEDDKQWLKDGCWNKNLNGEGCRFLYKQQIHFCSVPVK